MNIDKSKLGFHTAVEESLDLPSVDSLQMFLLDPTKMFDKTVNSRLNIYKNAIKKWRKDHPNRRMFVHASYTINLSNTQEFHVNSLRSQLKLANEIGASGVVIHCGKSLKDNKEKAKQRFIDNICKCLDRMTLECPLLIETCVGAGTELFDTVKEFSELLLTLKEKCGKKIGCCIDTAHVWGAGYDPIDFISSMDSKVLSMIKLIHFNNSKVHKGSNVDLHAPIHDGNIDSDNLWQIAQWAVKYNIPLVREHAC